MSDATKELLAKARQQASIEVTNWMPETVGDEIAGIVNSNGFITTDYGEVATSVLVDDDGTYWRLAWMGSVLAAAYQRYKPSPGDVVCVRYVGDVAPKNGMNEYRNFNVVVLHSDGSPKDAVIPNQPQQVVVSSTGEVLDQTF